MTAFNEQLALELLGFDYMPLPADPSLAYGDSAYLTEADFQVLGNIVCESVPGMAQRDWWQASTERRNVLMAEARNQLQAVQPGATATPEPEPTKPAKPKNAKKGTNARMLERMSTDPVCWGWTCTEWATFLKCSKPSVVATDAWKKLASERDKLRAGNALDRHRRSANRKPSD